MTLFHFKSQTEMGLITRKARILNGIVHSLFWRKWRIYWARPHSPQRPLNFVFFTQCACAYAHTRTRIHHVINIQNMTGRIGLIGRKAI